MSRLDFYFFPFNTTFTQITELPYTRVYAYTYARLLYKYINNSQH